MWFPEGHLTIVYIYYFSSQLLNNDYFNIEYSYNPCKPFSEGNTCINVAVCQG